MPEQAVTFPSGDLRLEGYLSRPEAGAAPGGVVVCHPHPSYGGEMSNPVVTTICHAVAAAGLATLRFNFRGTRCSTGTHSGGRLEPDDVRAAIAFLMETTGLSSGRIGVAGYSFGAMMALIAAATDERVAALATVSPVFRMFPVENLGGLSKPLLIVSGEEDSYVPTRDLRDLADRAPNTIELHIIPDEDHFWWNALADVGRLTGDFFRRYLGT
ncbi:MAG TPA: alpha/beta fold hydrolase [Dehalococcoidia bacterium]|nr:alpha/beta fold hydrolase [Dehalococcoidia bacterium]